MHSIITLVLGNVSLKHSDIVSITMSLVGHISTQLNLKYIKFVHVMMYLDTVDFDKLKTPAVSFSGEPSFNHDKKRNNTLKPVSFSRWPGFDTGDKKLYEGKISGLSFSLFFVGLYLIFSKFLLGFKQSYKMANSSSSQPVK